MELARAFRLSGTPELALPVLDRAIEIRRRRAGQDSGSWLAGGLALAYSHKAQVLEEMGMEDRTEPLHRRSVEIWETVVLEEGRTDSRGDLAAARLRHAHSRLLESREPVDREVYQEEVKILEAEAARTGRENLATTLAWVGSKMRPLMKDEEQPPST